MRNYSKPTNKVKAELKCQICNKKYKKELKRQQHVEKEHYYETRYNNNFKLNHETRAMIYASAATYIEALYSLKEPYDGESYAKNLLPQNPNETDLTQITLTQFNFAKKLLQENLLCDWHAVMDDLERFFNLGLPYYDTNFCPSLAIDFLWHALMQLPDLYNHVCKKSCVEIMPHCHQEHAQDDKRYDYFVNVFQYRFHTLPTPLPSFTNVYSCSDVVQLFNDLHDQELKYIEEAFFKEEKEKSDAIEKQQLSHKQRQTNLGIWSMQMKIPSSFIDQYTYYCREGYEKGYVGEALICYVNEELERIRNHHQPVNLNIYLYKYFNR